MEVALRWILVVCTMMPLSLMFPSTVNCDPIKIDFDKCQTAEYPGYDNSTTPISCCPIKPTKPILDGIPPLFTKEIRVRQASQCADEAYAAKLSKAYELMRALPDDDPRSFLRQADLHCSYCGGAFVTTNSSGIPVGVDIHFSWLFYPWHRYFLFFHERILQSLLGDPTFSLNYWNWDSPYTVGKGDHKPYLKAGDQFPATYNDSCTSEDDFNRSPNATGIAGPAYPGEFSSSFPGTSPDTKGKSNHKACLKAGDQFPAIYNDSCTFQYDLNRSANAKGLGRLPYPDFMYSPVQTAAQQTLFNASEEDLLASNRNVMYQSMVSGATTKEIFMGRPYRAGDSRGDSQPSGGAGSLEQTAHAGVHFWTGQEFPIGLDMGQLAFSARDPVFFAHHSNLDRLFTVWKDIGPVLGQKRDYYSDPDFLNAEFLFYDENKDLRRVYVRDTLDSKNLGYVYQEADDAAWLFHNASSCSKLSNLESVALAETYPVPEKDGKGYYRLEGGKSFIIVVDRPENPHGLEEFLTIDGIKLDRHQNAGFDVFVDLVNPSEYTVPSKCAEYTGRFMNMAHSHHANSEKKSFQWKQSVTQTLVDIDAPSVTAKLVITLVPLTSNGDKETIKFTSISVNTY